MDYRQLPADFEGQFDAFVSVEMVEVRIYVSTRGRKFDDSRRFDSIGSRH